MKKLRFVTLTTLTSLVLSLSPVLAQPPESQTATLETPGTTRTLHLPQTADNSPVIYLGTAVDPQSGKTVEGYALVRYKDAQVKPPSAGSKKPGSGSCY